MTVFRHIVLSLRNVNWILFTAMTGMAWVLLVRAYYHLKPLIPVWLRLSLRRLRARWKRGSLADSWPILDSAGTTPDGWPGWPDGRSFAIALSHDVGTQDGLDRVKHLAEIEMTLGFRSCFNFIPEGPYEVPEELIVWLKERGFEIGVHDHRRDGKLYQSRERFTASAERINHFLKKWNAVGFRSGFMLRNLEWISQLDILYDSSTFDTDPFEPQPDGANTIFPFWVPRPGGGGYVELPCTLPQGLTLFVVLGERSQDIWQQKLRWIASRGGMVLLNVSPDFTTCDRKSPGQLEFPIDHYTLFLSWVRATYHGDYWPALPRDIAAYCKENAFAVESTWSLRPHETPMPTAGFSSSNQRRVSS